MVGSNTRFAFKIAVLVGLLGFVVSRTEVLQWLAGFDPNLAFVLWYVVLATWLAAAYYVLFGRRIALRLNAAFMMLYFAIGIVFGWAKSGAALLNAGLGSPSAVPSFLLASEDQLVSSGLLALGVPVWLTIILTYVVVPAVLVFVAVGLISPKRGKSIVNRFLGRLF